MKSADCILAGLMCLAPVIVGGCASESPGARELVQRQIEAVQHREIDPKVEAMRAITGLWRVDIDATMAANRGLPEKTQVAVRQNMETYPFELEITEREYISRSSAKINADRYSILRVTGEVVTLKLESTDRVDRGSDRTVILRAKEGKLFITVKNTFVCVLSRFAPGR